MDRQVVGWKFFATLQIYTYIIYAAQTFWGSLGIELLPLYGTLSKIQLRANILSKVFGVLRGADYLGELPHMSTRAHSAVAVAAQSEDTKRARNSTEKLIDCHPEG